MRKKLKTSSDSLSALYAEAIHEFLQGTWVYREIEDRGNLAIIFALCGSHILRLEITEDTVQVFMAKPKDADTTCVLRVSLLDPLSFDKIKKVIVDATPSKTKALEEVDSAIETFLTGGSDPNG